MALPEGPHPDAARTLSRPVHVGPAAERQLARLFNDLRRSTAALHLAGLVAGGLVTAEELAGFSEATRARPPDHEVRLEEHERLG